MSSSKVYIGNLGQEVDKESIEQEFSKFGPIKDVWIARNPPGFAFVVYNDPRDAEEAVRVMDSKRICGSKLKVELSHTANGRRGGRGGGARGPDRSGQSRPAIRYKSPPRMQYSRGGGGYGERNSRGSSPPRGPPRGPLRRSEEMFEPRSSGYSDRDRYIAEPPSRDRYYDRNPRDIDDGFRANGYRRDGPGPHSSYDKYPPERFSERYDDRYGAPPSTDRFSRGDTFADRPPPRGMERFSDRRSDRGTSDRYDDRYQESRMSRRSPPPRGPMPPKMGRMVARSPPSRRGGRSPISRRCKNCSSVWQWTYNTRLDMTF
eukprot:gene13987-15445_t